MLDALEASWPAYFLRTSFYAYPLVNSLHILAIGALVTTAAMMDLRVLGLGRRVPLEITIATLRPLAIGALAVAAISGFLLFSVRPAEYFQNPVFQIKMLVLAIALANALAFTSFRAHRRPEAAGARLMAVLSITLWLGVLIAGRFIGFLE